MAEPLRLPPPNRNRLLPISIALLTGRNPRIRGFGWGRVGVGGRHCCHISRPHHPRPLPTRGRGEVRGNVAAPIPPRFSRLSRRRQPHSSGERPISELPK